MYESTSALARLDPVEAWQPWTPDSQHPWTLKWAGHLCRRAAFGATWTELQEAVQAGPEETLDKLLAGGDGLPEFNTVMDALWPQAADYREEANSSTYQTWWLYRMIHSPHPFQERMTLFWHNHFATSIVKVRRPLLMKQQNQLLRGLGLGKCRPLVLAISRDPAMLVWLDSNSNVKGKPNENYARELMELFTLGVGNYTENDVREAARAFTGWHTNERESRRGDTTQVSFVFRKFQHDDGPKTVLGQSGQWNGDDVVRIVLEQPAAARFLVRKLYRHFVSEASTPPERLLEPLAEQFRKTDYDIAALMRTILRSRHFYSEFAYRQRIKSPVEYLAGLLRALEGRLPSASDERTQPMTLDGLGQTLFAPPSVKGWDGGRAWLNSATLLARHNLAWHLIREPSVAKVDPLALVRKYGDQKDADNRVEFLLKLLLQPAASEIDERARKRLADFLAEDHPMGAALDQRLRETIHAILLMPLYQLA